MGNLFCRWVNTPTKGELRQAQFDAIDRAWLEHKKTTREHTCSICFMKGFDMGQRRGFKAGLKAASTGEP